MAFFSSLSAINPNRKIGDYLIKTWKINDGLPQNTINSIVQTPDGYMWFATQNGLTRFNGVKFKIFDRFTVPDWEFDYVNILLTRGDGTLLIGSMGGGLYKFVNDTVIPFDLSGRLPENLSIMGLEEDAQGRLWIASEDGMLFCQQEGKIRRVDLPFEYQKPKLNWLFLDHAGVLWIGSSNGLIRFEKGNFRRYTNLDGLSHNFVIRIFESRDKRLWIGTEGGGLNCLVRDRFLPFQIESGLPSDDIMSISQDRDDNIWVGTRGGLCRIDGKNRIDTFTSLEGLTNDSVTSLYEDREGNLWVGTGYGLSQFRDSPTVMIDRRSGIPSNFVWSVYEDDDHSLWIGTNNYGIIHIKEDRISSISKKNGLPSAVVRCMLRDRENRFWIGGLDGLCRIQEGMHVVYKKKDGLADSSIRCVFEDRQGMIWAGTQDGLSYFKEGRFHIYPFSEEIPRPLVINRIFQDNTGSLWLGTRNGAVQIRNNKVEWINSSRGFSSSIVYTIVDDREGNLWFGTVQGVFGLISGAFHRLGRKDGLPDEVIYGMCGDQSDNLWCGSNRGIFRLNSKQARDFLKGKQPSLKIEQFGTTEGLKSLECNGGNQNSALAASDGRIMFPTQEGVAVIDPGQKRRTSPLPPIRIESVSADGRPLTLSEKTALPPGANRIEFQFAALSYTSPEKNLFRYRLDPFDRDWQEAGNNRAAFYTNLAPGDYTFQVAGSDHEGRWSRETAFFSFSIQPFFTQTKFFYILVALFLFMTGVGINHIRVKNLKKREKELSAMVAERTQQLAEANQELQRLANLDGLTGVANRRHFDSILEEEWKRNSRADLPLSLVMIDVDFFKNYNDCYGHQTGDDCLRSLTAVLKKTVTRTGDLIARYGGEEFCLILPATDLAGAAQVAEKLRGGVEALGIEHQGSTCNPCVTISLGVTSTRPTREKSLDAFLLAADEALYRAKKNGKNRVEFQNL